MVKPDFDNSALPFYTFEWHRYLLILARFHRTHTVGSGIGLFWDIGKGAPCICSAERCKNMIIILRTNAFIFPWACLDNLVLSSLLQLFMSMSLSQEQGSNRKTIIYALIYIHLSPWEDRTFPAQYLSQFLEDWHYACHCWGVNLTMRFILHVTQHC